MAGRWLFWAPHRLPNVCQLGTVKGVDKRWELEEGAPRAATWGDGATFQMDERAPYNTLLADNLYNVSDVIVGSARLREILETKGVPKIEYLPVKILDHKGRAVDQEYVIIHPIELIECLDLPQCEPEYSSIDTSSITRVKKFVMEESKIDPGRLLFRPKSFGRVALAHRDLIEAIDSAGLTGIRWVELDDYSKL